MNTSIDNLFLDEFQAYVKRSVNYNFGIENAIDQAVEQSTKVLIGSFLREKCEDQEIDIRGLALALGIEIENNTDLEKQIKLKMVQVVSNKIKEELKVRIINKPSDMLEEVKNNKFMVLLG